MKVRYGRRAVLLADRNQQTVACKKKNKQTQVAKTEKKGLKPNDVKLQFVHMLKNIDLCRSYYWWDLVYCLKICKLLKILTFLVHCCTLSLCHLGSEMIITDIQISIQRSSSGLLTRSDPCLDFFEGFVHMH